MSRKTLRLVWLGIGVLLLSTVVIGMGNTLATKKEPPQAVPRTEEARSGQF